MTHKCVDAAIVQEFEVFDHGDRAEPQIDRVALLAQQSRELFNQGDLGVFGHSHDEGPAGTCRLELRRFAEGVLYFSECVLDRNRQFAGARSRLHSSRRSHKQSVVEQIAQTHQCRAHRGLRQADSGTGSRNRAFGEDGVECLQKIEVDGSEIIRHAPAHTSGPGLVLSTDLPAHATAAKASRRVTSGMAGSCVA
jgi:hypothetical protein